MQASSLLESARVARLATGDARGRPHVVPIVFAWRDGVVYTPIDLKPKRHADPRRLRRVRNILEDPRVAVVVDEYQEDWSRLAYVLLEGTATLLESGAERDAAAALLEEKYPQYAALPLAGRPIVRVAVEKMSSWPAER